MTIKEANNFYMQDEMKYEINTNKEFLLWYDSLLKDGYIPYLKTLDIEEMINKLVTWYEIKYPEKELMINEGILYSDFKNLDKLSDKMTYEELLYRLSNKESSILNCTYRSRSGGFHYNIELKRYIPTNLVYIKRIDNSDKEIELYYNKKYPIFIEALTGKILNISSLKFEEYYNMNIHDLYNDLKKDNEYDLSEVKKIIKINNYDKLLRNKILELSALKLLYSKNTTPELGYKRARLFIKEFNHELNLNLERSEIDLIMMTDYKEDKQDIKLNKNNLKNMVKEQKQMIKRMNKV